MAVILLEWARWNSNWVRGGSPDSTDIALQAVSSHLPNKVAQTAAGTIGWIFLTTLQANMDHAPHYATLVHSIQRCLEKLEQCILA